MSNVTGNVTMGNATGNGTMGNTTANTTEYAYEQFYETNIDYAVGVPYLLLGLVGIYTNGTVIWTFLTIRKTAKLLPFLVCAICLAYNDLIMCMFDFTPYAILVLLGRPQKVNSILCSFIGFVNNFCEKFAWFNITSIMVFRCASLIFPLKCRNISHRPVLALLAIYSVFIVIISAIPFLPVDFVHKKYEYIPNLAECSYQFDTNVVGMLTLIDVIWWTPFITCVVSCAAFVIVMGTYKARFQGVLASKNTDVVKKTVTLTIFFIVCYFPKVFQSLVFYVAGENTLFSWTDLENHIGYPVLVYFHLFANYLVPAVRAALTPVMLRLKAYILMCNTSKRASNALQTEHTRIRKNSKNSVLPNPKPANFLKRHFENKKAFDNKKKDSFKDINAPKKKFASELVQLV